MTTSNPYEDDARRLALTKASEITPRAVRWAWQWEGAGRIPAGSLALAAGREGTGKSSFGMWLAAQITAGTLPGVYQGNPRNVLYVAVEDSWEYTLVPRLMAAGADLGRVYRVQAVAEFDEEVSITLPYDLTRLQGAIEQASAALVVFDPLMSLLGEGLSASKSREVRRMLDPLVRIAQRTDCIMLGIAHHNKGAHSDPIMSVSESKAWTDVPRSVFAFARDDESGARVMSQTKNSLGVDPSQMASLQYQIEGTELRLSDGVTSVGKFVVAGVSDKSVTDIVRDQGYGTDIAERNEAQSFLFDYLARNGGEGRARDAMKAGRAAGFSEQAIKDARRRMRPKVVTRKDGLGGWVWSFDQAPTEVMQAAQQITDPTPDSDAGHENGEDGAKRASLYSPSTFATFATFDPPAPPSQPSPYCPHGGPIGMPCTQCPNGEAVA